MIVVLADKLSNLRSIHRDYGLVGDLLWERFNQKDKRMHAWYYRAIADALSSFSGEPAYDEYCRLVESVFTEDDSARL